jgi:uncharacterized pyridoxamine 5'-phosphate oxidase family protein
MSHQKLIKEYVADALQTNMLAVLATEGEGQPHASLIAITPLEDFTYIIFATYRSTRKYNNLINNGKVAILFENRSTKSMSQPDITVVTAFGMANEVEIASSGMALKAHLLRHPELEAFLHSADCALFQVKVNAYQMVRGIDDINWWKLNELESE